MPPREKRPDPDRLILKMSPEAEKRCRDLMARISRADKRHEKRLKKRDEKRHEKKMAWYDRFNQSLEKMLQQMRIMERASKEIEAHTKQMRSAQKKDRVRSARPHRRSTS